LPSAANFFYLHIGKYNKKTLNFANLGSFCKQLFAKKISHGVEILTLGR